MSTWRGIRRLFSLGLWGPEVEEGVEWEIEHHLQERADELEAEGLTREEALAEARRQFGDIDAVRRELRATDRGRARRRRLGLWLETVWQDARYGLRAMLRAPAFAATLVLTLGLGIGAAVAVFGVVDALLLRPLPFAASHELAKVVVQYGESGWQVPSLPAEVARAWERTGATFDGLLPNRRTSVLYTGGEPRELSAQEVAPSFEEVLGVSPALGRGFAPRDAAPGASPVALVSHGFWRSELGGTASAVGRSIRLDHREHTVIGVMPPGFKFPEYSATDVWLPLPEAGAGGRMTLVVRAGPGGMEAARAQARTVGSALFAELQGRDSVQVTLAPLEESRGGNDELRRAVWLLAVAVGLILLVAMVNGANLLLVRGARRTGELAVRMAVGGSRSRVVRQLLTETLLAALAAGVTAVAVAWVSLRAVHGLLPDMLVFWLPHAVEVEERAMTLAFAVAAVAGLLLGLLPALRGTRAARGDTADGLVPTAGGSRPRSRLRRGLIVAEVAFSALLLAGAGLLLNSFSRLTDVDVGVDTERLAFVQLPISATAQPDSGARVTFLPRLVERLRGLPGVTDAAAMGTMPAGRLRVGVRLQVEGRDPAGGDPEILPSARVGPDFFRVTGARLLAGRPFRPGEEDVVIVDEDMARHLWPAGDVVGRRVRLGEGAPWLTVVGVMNDIQLERRDNAWGDFEILEPFDSDAVTNGHVTVAVRTAGDPARVFPAIRAVIRELAPTQPVQEIVPAETAYGEALQLPRFLAVVVAGVAAFALVLAAVGLFGVLGYEVAQRRREIGIRSSLGATAAELRWMVAREGLRLAAFGAVLGLAAALALGRFIRGLLFDIEPSDPFTLGATLAVLVLAAAVATYLPARRATRVDPAEALRVE